MALGYHHYFVFLIFLATLIIYLYTRGAFTQDHLPLARRSPGSRDNRAALTRTPIGGEVRADFCLLGFTNVISYIIINSDP